MNLTTLPATSKSRERVLGIPIDLVDMASAVDRCRQLIQLRTPSLVFTADSSGLVLAEQDAEFRNILLNAALTTPDSSGVVWALRRKGHRHVGRVCGIDLMEQLCSLSSDSGIRLFLLGAAPGVAESAAERLRLQYPGCNIVGTRHGYFPADDDEIVAQEVAAVRPDVLFVAMGMPRQEKFIAKTMAIIGAPVSIGVGGSFDVFSGKAKRAPGPIRRLKLEWLWRVLLNPSKFEKVKRLPRFIVRVLREKA